MKIRYKGRFAPSPTGPLHFGSLVTALASYLDARSAGGHWLLRIDELDKPRTVSGADADILRTLEKFGFEWDGPVVYQSHRAGLYREALDRLQRQQAIYPCTCSRRDVAGNVYRGACREGMKEPGKPASWRVRVDGPAVEFEDRVYVPQVQDVASESGDFVVLRADGVIAYQLAVLVDDAAEGVTDVVRGADLLTSTGRQIYLQRLLGLSQPRYMHIPVVTNASGEKLSKQTFAPALNTAEPTTELREALRFLGQVEAEGTAAEMLRVAVAHWNPAAVPHVSGPRE